MSKPMNFKIEMKWLNGFSTKKNFQDMDKAVINGVGAGMGRILKAIGVESSQRYILPVSNSKRTDPSRITERSGATRRAILTTYFFGTPNFSDGRTRGDKGSMGGWNKIKFNKRRGS